MLISFLGLCTQLRWISNYACILSFLALIDLPNWFVNSCTFLVPILDAIVKAEIAALYSAFLLEAKTPNLMPFSYVSLEGDVMTYPLPEPFLLCELSKYTV